MMIKCFECGSTNLVVYKEEVRAYEQKITSKGTITKRRKLVASDRLNPDHIQCKDCGERFDYGLDDNGVINKLF